MNFNEMSNAEKLILMGIPLMGASEEGDEFWAGLNARSYMGNNPVQSVYNDKAVERVLAVDYQKLRRRVEDRLRKIDDKFLLLQIATMLKVNL